MRYLFPLLLSAALISACGGGGSSNSDHELTGTWFGTADLLTTDAGYGTFTLDIDADGKVQSFTADGSDLDLTAEQYDKIDGFYLYEASNGAEFFLRRIGNNLGYAAPNDEVALLERGADARPSYDLTDITGAYSGTEFIVDFDYNLLAVNPGTGQISGDSSPLNFNAATSDGSCETNGLLNLASSTAGVYTGTFENVSGTGCYANGQVKAYLSPDRDTMLMVACQSFTDFSVPSDCSFLLAGKDG